MTQVTLEFGNWKELQRVMENFLNADHLAVRCPDTMNVWAKCGKWYLRLNKRYGNIDIEYATQR